VSDPLGVLSTVCGVCTCDSVGMGKVFFVMGVKKTEQAWLSVQNPSGKVVFL
jgi:hypothetical protein